MGDPKERPETDETGGLTPRPTGAERQEEFQRTREQAAAAAADPTRYRADEKERGKLAAGHLERTASDSGSADAERIEHLDEERAEHRGRSEGEAHKQWERKPNDLDREDAAIHREGIQGEKPGERPQADAEFARNKG